MLSPKDKKKKKKEEDTDFTDERGGGTDDVFTKEDFFRVLNRAIKPQGKKPVRKKSKKKD